ncbi:MAG: FlgD immunoglobulin-like domain containing protein [Elusimicrobiota bacterium]
MRKIFFLNIIFVSLSFGYDNLKVHPGLTLRSLDLISSNNNSYEELKIYEEKIIQGTRDEDIPDYNVLNHFYNPVTGKGLTIPGHSFDPSIVKGNILLNEAIFDYQFNTNFNEAYYKLGKALHLMIQDMAQPQHLHDDAHAPIRLHGDGTRYEDYSEIKFLTVPRANSLTISPQNLITLSKILSQHTYYDSMFPGTHDQTSILITLPDNKKIKAFYVPEQVVDSTIVTPSQWIIRGKNRLLRYNPSKTGDGLALGESSFQNWWRVPEQDSEFYYFDLQENWNEEISIQGVPLELYYINKFVPLAEEYGASFIKLFHDIVNLPPSVKDIEIRDRETGSLIYESHIIPDINNGNKIINKRIYYRPKFEKQYSIKIIFSEPVEQVNFLLGTQTVTIQQNDEKGEEWKGVFEIPRTPSSGSFFCDDSNTLPIYITAKDLHYHQVLPGQNSLTLGAPIDENPKTPSLIKEVNNYYEWTGYETTGLSQGEIPKPCTCDLDADTDAPLISLTDIPNPSCLANTTLSVSGHVSDNCILQSLTIDNEPVSMTPNLSSTTFTKSIVLPEGPSQIDICATDMSGNEHCQTKQVTVDNQPPQVTLVQPLNGATEVATNASVKLSYDEPLSEGYISGSAAGNSVRGANNIEYTHPTFAIDRTYHFSAHSVKDTCGNISPDMNWSFTTQPFLAEILSPRRDDPTNNHWEKRAELPVKVRVQNPLNIATITVCMAGGCQTQVAPASENQTLTFNFDLTGKEDAFVITMNGNYRGFSATDSSTKKIDNKPPTLLANPQTSIEVDSPDIDISLFGSDSASGLKRLSYGQISNTYSPNQNIKSASTAGTHKGLVFGNNTLTAFVEDQVGNITTANILIRRSGHAKWEMKTIENHCGGPAHWQTLLEGTPGLQVLTVLTRPRGSPINRFQKISSEGTLINDFNAADVGSYKLSVRVKVPNTGEVVLQKEINTGIGVCRPDPTFISELPILEPTPPDKKPESFSPGSSIGIQDSYQTTYSARYSRTQTTIDIYDYRGRLIKNLFSASQNTGLYSLVWDGKNQTGHFVDEGLYTIRIHERNLDVPSIQDEERILVEVDKTAPLVSLERLEAVAESPKVIAVWGGIRENNPQRIEINRIHGNQINKVYSESLPINKVFISTAHIEKLANIDTSGWGEGTYQLQIEVIDLAGNRTIGGNNLTYEVFPSNQPVVHIAAGILGQNLLPGNNEIIPADSPQTFIEDELPLSATAIGDWNWSAVSYSGNKAHTTTGAGAHYFIHAKPGIFMGTTDNLIQYIYRSQEVKEIILQVYTDQGNGEHRVYWGENLYPSGGTPGSVSLVYAGALPPANRWVRLRIPAESIGIQNKTVKGILFASEGGQVLWDKTTTSNNTMDPGGLSATLAPSSLAGDSAQTELIYHLNQPTALKVDVVGTSSDVIKTLLMGNSDDPACCTEGDHLTSWDQKSTTGNVMPDGNYAFLISPLEGAIDTEIFAQDPSFDPLQNSYPQLQTLPVHDANGNKFFIDFNRIVKKNASGLMLANVVVLTSGTIQSLGINERGDIFFQDSFSHIHKYQAGRVPFNINNITSYIRIPWNKAMVKATVPIVGGAGGRQFKEFKIDVAPGWPEDTDKWGNSLSSWTLLNKSVSPVVDQFVLPPGISTVYGNLASWETGLTPGEEYPEQDIFHPQSGDLYRGRWTVRNTVFNVHGSSKVALVPVIVGRVINNAVGGVVRSDDNKVSVSIPALSMDQEWTVMGLIHFENSTQEPGLPIIPSNFRQVSSIYEFLPPAFQFRRSVKMTFEIPEIDSHTAHVDLYEYEQSTQHWKRLETIRELNGDKPVLTFKSLNKLSAPRAFYALLERTGVPPPPLLFEPLTPTQNRFISLHGKAEPLAQVFGYTTEFSTSLFPVETTANETGEFSTPPLYLTPGVYSLSVSQLPAGFSQVSSIHSEPSTPVTIQVLAPPPIVPTKLEFVEEDGKTPRSLNIKPNETVFIKLTGSDTVSSQADIVYANIKSEISDIQGIIIPLVETAPNSGIYLGSFHMGDRSDVGGFQLKVLTQGEKIEARLESHESFQATAYFDGGNNNVAPEIVSPSHSALFQHTFETGNEGWSIFDPKSGCSIAISSDTETSNRSLRVKQEKPGNFSVLITNTPFDVRQFPLFSFDVKMNQPVRFNFFFKINNHWKELVFSDTRELPKVFPPSFDRLGSLEDEFGNAPIIPNNEWKQFNINLFNLLFNNNSKLINDSDFIIQEIIIGDWDARDLFGVVPGNTQPGSWVEFDNVIINNGGVNNSNPEFSWSLEPLQSASGYSLLLDESAHGIPAETINTENTLARYLDVQPGYHTFHLRARDQNERWGPVNHFRFLVDSSSPYIDSKEPAPGSRSDSQIVKIYWKDPKGEGLNPASVLFSINGKQYNKNSGALFYDEKNGLLQISLGAIKPVPPILLDGQNISFSIDDATDFAGNHITEPIRWNWTADFSQFSGGDFVPLTVNGGREASWSPEGEKIVFVSDRNNQTDLWVISSTASAESGQMANWTHDLLVERNPSWSPNGKWIVYEAVNNNQTHLWILNTETLEKREITTGNSEDTHPSWSTLGDQLVFSRKTNALANLYRLDINPNTGQVMTENQITFDTVGYNYEPVFSQFNNSILYRRSLYQDNIFSIHLNGTNTRPLTTGNKEFSPRSKNKDIFFVSKRNGNLPTLWVMDEQGRNAKVFLENNNLHADYDPVWSIDGNRLAFTSFRSGSANIWTMTLLEVKDFNVTPSRFSPIAVSSPTCDISFHVTASGAKGRLLISGSHGFSKELLNTSTLSSGTHHFIWDGKSDLGQWGDSGFYTAQLRIEPLGSPEPILKEVNITLDMVPPVSKLSSSSGEIPFVSTQSLLSIQTTDLPSNHTENKITAYYSINNSDFQKLTEPFSVPAGTQTLRYYSVDSVGNNEVVQLQTLYVDDVPPLVFLSPEEPYFEGATNLYISSLSALNLEGNDQIVNAQSVLSGHHLLQYQMDGETPVFSSQSPLRIPINSLRFISGNHNLTYQSYDKSGNSSGQFSKSFFVDTVMPTVFVSSSQLIHNGVHTFARPETAIEFFGLDFESGIEKISYQIGNEAPQIFVATRAFWSALEGEHNIQFFSEDQVGNISNKETLNLIVTNNPPSTYLEISGPRFRDFVSDQTKFIVHRATGSAVSSLEINIDGQGFIPYPLDSPYQFLSAGLHTFGFRGVLPNGETEWADEISISVDTQAPTQNVSFSSPTFELNNERWVGVDTLMSILSTDTVIPYSGVSTARYSLNNSTKNYVAPFTPKLAGISTEGSYLLSVQSEDNVNNKSEWENFPLRVDASAPLSQLNMGQPQIQISGKIYVSSNTLFWLEAHEQGNIISGLHQISYSTGSAFNTFTSSFNITSEGSTQLSYFSSDRVGNHEPIKRLNFITDISPPDIRLEPLGTSYQNGETLFITPDTLLVGVAPDTLSGLRLFQRSLNNEDFVDIDTPIRIFDSGYHRLRLKATDQVLNSAMKNFSILVDGEPPISTLTFLGDHYIKESTPVLKAGTLLALSSTDTLSGVRSTQYLIDNQAIPTDYVSPISLSPGSHLVRYFSSDFVNNNEPVHEITVVVDQEAPVTERLLPPTATIQNSNIFVSTGTWVEIKSSDRPLLMGVGVMKLEWRFNDSVPNVLVSSGSQSLSAYIQLNDLGIHTIKTYGADLFGNQENEKTFTLWVTSSPPTPDPVIVDISSPVTSVFIEGNSIDLAGHIFVSPKSQIKLLAQDASQNASGVAGIYARWDSNNYASFSSSWPVFSGSHTLSYYAVDNAGNIEIPHTLTVHSAPWLEPGFYTNDKSDFRGFTHIQGDIFSGGSFNAKGKGRVSGKIRSTSIQMPSDWVVEGEVNFDPVLFEDLPMTEIENMMNLQTSLPDIHLQDNSLLHLSSGSYFYRSLVMEGQSRLEVEGPVQIYVLNKFSISENAQIVSSDSFHQVLFVALGEEKISIHGGKNSHWHGLLLAPARDIQLSGTARLTGSVYAKNLFSIGSLILKSGAENDPIDFFDEEKLASALDATFELKNLYAYPNPAQKGDIPKIHVEVGVAEHVECLILDSAGEFVRQIENRDFPIILNTPQGPQFSYEFVIDGHLPSGVYRYIVTAKKASETLIRRTGQFTVIR